MDKEIPVTFWKSSESTVVIWTTDQHLGSGPYSPWPRPVLSKCSCRTDSLELAARLSP